jgi:F0F1-type ATP synthase assembly protein I
MSEPEAPTVRRRRLQGILISVACLMTLLGLGISLAHYLHPSPLFFTIFMLAGQPILGISMVLFGVVMVRELKRKQVL